MSSTLNDPQLRLSLQTSSGGCAGIVYNLDASISTIVFPTDSVFQQAFNPKVQLTNRGATTLTSVSITYQVDGQIPDTFEWTGSLTSLQSTIDTLPTYYTGEGGHVFTAWTSNPNNGTDEWIYNDTANSNFITKSLISKNSTSIIPNIDGDLMTITVENPSAPIMYVQLVNAIGQIMFSENVDMGVGSVFKLSLTDYAPGMYFLYGQVGYDFVKQKIMIMR